MIKGILIKDINIGDIRCLIMSVDGGGTKLNVIYSMIN